MRGRLKIVSDRERVAAIRLMVEEYEKVQYQSGKVQHFLEIAEATRDLLDKKLRVATLVCDLLRLDSFARHLSFSIPAIAARFTDPVLAKLSHIPIEAVNEMVAESGRWVDLGKSTNEEALSILIRRIEQYILK